LADPIVDQVARAVNLTEGRRGVEAVLAALARLEPVSVRALSRAVDLPVPIVAAVCGELRQRGLVSERRPVQFTLEGRRQFAKAGASIATACPTCGGRGVALPPALARLRRGLASVADSAPPPLVDLDQCHCTPKTKLRRLLAMHDAGSIGGRRILMLGDDDLMSVALLRFARQFRMPIEELAVLDIDERLLDFIGAELDGAPFPHQCLRWDARQELPSSLAGSFDTVVTDPPYTAAGARLFLTGAVKLLHGEGSDVFLSFGSRRPGVQLQVQRTIVELGMEIRSLTRDFNDYLGAGVLGGTSHLYHLAVAPHASIDETLYTGARSRADATPRSVAYNRCAQSTKEAERGHALTPPSEQQ
jgi:N4-bis(aminopropyl)spermidine synthase